MAARRKYQASARRPTSGDMNSGNDTNRPRPKQCGDGSSATLRSKSGAHHGPQLRTMTPAIVGFCLRPAERVLSQVAHQRHLVETGLGSARLELVHALLLLLMREFEAFHVLECRRQIRLNA